MVVGFRSEPPALPSGHQVELMKSKSGAPSSSKSKKATPPPIVSGRSLSPAAPLLCTKVMPDAAVMSVNFAIGTSAWERWGAVGTLRAVTFWGWAAGFRLAYQIAPPARAARVNKVTADHRKAR